MIAGLGRSSQALFVYKYEHKKKHELQAVHASYAVIFS